MKYLERRKRSSAGELFWLLPGMTYADTLAAFRFTNVNTESDAKTDLTGHGYTLGNGDAYGNHKCSWDSGNGFYVDFGHYLDNSDLRGAGVRSLVMKIWGGGVTANLPLTGQWANTSVWVKTPFETASFWPYSAGFGIAHQNGLSIDYENPDQGIYGTLARQNVRTAGNTVYTDGVIGISLDGWGKLYRNGSEVSLNNAVAGNDSAYPGPWTRFESAGLPLLVGGTGSTDHHTYSGHFYITYLAVYSRVLSGDEQAAIAAKMV